MSKYLKHFTSVGDNRNKHWDEEDNKEKHEEPEEKPSQTPHPFTSSYSFRDALKWLFASHKFHIGIVCLVILDALFVLIEILLDLELLVEKVDHIIPEIIHYLSISVLSFSFWKLLANCMHSGCSCTTSLKCLMPSLS